MAYSFKIKISKDEVKKLVIDKLINDGLIGEQESRLLADISSKYGTIIAEFIIPEEKSGTDCA